MLKYTLVKMIEVRDWDQLVSSTYGRPYSLQQQNGCQDRGLVHFTVPSNWSNDEDMADDIPEKVNGEKMGVKFATWLARDPLAPVAGKSDYSISLFWARNFYPDFDTVVNDLHAKGLLPAGDYKINIDW